MNNEKMLFIISNKYPGHIYEISETNQLLIDGKYAGIKYSVDTSLVLNEKLDQDFETVLISSILEEVDKYFKFNNL
jgi:hypothetical protein